MPESTPEFFLVREDNTITPLIALDELPPDVSIRGVPRTMTLAETSGMKNLGTVPSRGIYYNVDSLSVRVGNTRPANESFATTPYNGGSKGKNRYSERKGNGSPSKQEKVYCSFWIRRGECDFEQQGCRYKHVMPMDAETLASVGLSHIPQWYLERQKMKSQRSNGPWRKVSTPPKSIAYPNEGIQDNGNSLGSPEKPNNKALDHRDIARPSPERIGRASGFENTGGYPFVQDLSLVSRASTPSMSHTAGSPSPRSSLEENVWSPTDAKLKRHRPVTSGGQASENLGNTTEPEYRSITELLPFSMPEDWFGNITTERLTIERPMVHWCWGPYF